MHCLLQLCQAETCERPSPELAPHKVDSLADNRQLNDHGQGAQTIHHSVHCLYGLKQQELVVALRTSLCSGLQYTSAMLHCSTALWAMDKRLLRNSTLCKRISCPRMRTRMDLLRSWNSARSTATRNASAIRPCSICTGTGHISDGGGILQTAA